MKNVVMIINKKWNIDKQTMRKQTRFLIFLVFILVLFFNLNNNLFAGVKDFACKASFINPITDIHWSGLFPIEIAGVEVKGPATEDNPDKLGGIVCYCKVPNGFVFGIRVSYWNPVRIIELTKVPGCFPTFGGMHVDITKSGTKHGTIGEKDDAQKTGFFNSHLIYFNALDILNLFLDVPCVKHEGLDIAYLSEIDPTWNNDVVAMFMHPEAILFANPITQMACVADSAAATAGWPLDPLFWCSGSWGSVYPFTGFGGHGDIIQASALEASKLIYRNTRLIVSWDTAIDVCGAVITPVWIKSHHKIQEVKPVKGPILPIGRAPLLWEYFKDPPFGTKKNAPDNFSWILFKRVKCCLGKTIGSSGK
ncbi:MAG: TraU family protein [Brevinematia bacterium]